MSWIPGISYFSNWVSDSKNNSTNLPTPLDPQDSNNTSSNIIKPTYIGNSLNTIDPSGFERAAEAIKDINRSPHASKVLEITLQQERTKQSEYALQQDQLRLSLLSEKQKYFDKEQEEKKLLMQQQLEHQKYIENHRDQLERKRYSDKLAQEKHMMAEKLRLEEESVSKQEQARKRTIDYENSMRMEASINKIKTKMSARGEIERKNQDLILNQIRLKEEERRRTVLKSIIEINSAIGNGLLEIFTDVRKLGYFVGGLSCLALGIYTTKNITLFARNYLESILAKPKLVRDTSKISILKPFSTIVSSARRLIASPQFVMEGIFFNPELANRLQNIANSTFYTRSNKGIQRNMYLYGPPGTGKTLYAKSLAWNSGMDYALLTGGDIVPLGSDAVTEIHKLFKWAKTSRKGLLIFVDEADSFLKNRSSENMSENLNSALNAFLYLTGEPSKKLKLIISSNQPYQFDSAILDRIDDIIEVDFPELDQRIKMLKFYFTKYLSSHLKSRRFSSSKISLPNIDYDIKFHDIALTLEGFSGREIVKLVTAWQSKTYASEDGSLFEKDMDECVEIMLKQHNVKIKWTS